MFSFQQLNVPFMQKMRYIAVDISHILIVLFICIVLNTQNRSHTAALSTA